MLITLEPDGVFVSNFIYLSILTLSSHWYEKSDEASTTQLTKKRWLNVVTTLYFGCENVLLNVQVSFIGEFSQCLQNVFVQHCRKTFLQPCKNISIIPLQPLNVMLLGSQKGPQL